MLKKIRNLEPTVFYEYRYKLKTIKEDKIIGEIIIIPHNDKWLMLIISDDLTIIEHKYHIEYVNNFNEAFNKIYYLSHKYNVPIYSCS
jgi:hypothetical protein